MHWIHQQYKFGFKSCFHQTVDDIVIRLVMGVLVQILCGYVTLPLYALVTQVNYSFLCKIKINIYYMWVWVCECFNRWVRQWGMLFSPKTWRKVSKNGELQQRKISHKRNKTPLHDPTILLEIHHHPLPSSMAVELHPWL